MSRKTDDNSNKGREYTDEGYNIIAINLIWGMATPERMAAAFKRKNAVCIRRAFDRICRDATDYAGKKEYDIKPPTFAVKLDRLNFYAKTFVREQFILGKPPHVISSKVGIDEIAIVDFLQSEKRI